MAVTKAFLLLLVNLPLTVYLFKPLTFLIFKLITPQPLTNGWATYLILYLFLLMIELTTFLVVMTCAAIVAGISVDYQIQKSKL